MNKYALYIGESTGLKIFKYFIKNKIHVNYVVTSDKRYKKIIDEICKKNNIIFIFTKKLNVKKIITLNINTNIILSIYSRLIIQSKIIKEFKGKIFNLHPGILPFYAGTNSISGTLYNNEKYTGLSFHLVTPKIDAGKIAYIKKIKINKKDSAIDVWRKIKKCSVKALRLFLLKLNKNKIKYKYNNIKLRKNFPKHIPNNGYISSKIKYNDLMKLYKASYYFPYISTWGDLKFKYKNQTKYILSIKKLRRKIINKNILKIKNKEFFFKIRNNLLLIKTI